ncbi:hypothetical protein OAM67_00795 [bacterium]|nr:hypothetical protein [bacterium]
MKSLLWIGGALVVLAVVVGILQWYRHTCMSVTVPYRPQRLLGAQQQASAQAQVDNDTPNTSVQAAQCYMQPSAAVRLAQTDTISPNGPSGSGGSSGPSGLSNPSGSSEEIVDIDLTTIMEGSSSDSDFDSDLDSNFDSDDASDGLMVVSETRGGWAVQRRDVDAIRLAAKKKRRKKRRRKRRKKQKPRKMKKKDPKQKKNYNENTQLTSTDTNVVPQISFRHWDNLYFVFVTNTDYDATTGQLTVPINLEQCTSFEVYEASIPKGEYAVNDYNNQIKVIDGDDANVTFTGTLVNGEYTATELATHMQAVLADSNIITNVQYSQVTLKFVFTGSKDFQLDFPLTLTGYTLGFGSTRPVASSSNVLTSTYRVDLFGGRFLTVKCTDLLASYVNTTTVANIALATGLNFSKHTTDHVRSFVAPKDLNTLTLDMNIALPNGKIVNYNNAGLTFNITFLVKTQVVTANTMADI